MDEDTQQSNQAVHTEAGPSIEAERGRPGLQFIGVGTGAAPACDPDDPFCELPAPAEAPGPKEAASR